MIEVFAPAVEQSLQAQYLVPMAISLGFGIVFATAIILVIAPCLYVALEDIAGVPARFAADPEPATETSGEL